MTVAENLMMGNLPINKFAGIEFTDQKKMNEILEVNLQILLRKKNSQKMLEQIQLVQQNLFQKLKTNLKLL